MTDQHSANALSCAGNNDVSTPNIDRLAQRGVHFDNTYCALPLSGPSRAAMFTGYMPSEIEMLFDMDNDRLEMTNLAIEARYRDTVKEHRELLRQWMEATLPHEEYPKTRIIPVE